MKHRSSFILHRATGVLIAGFFIIALGAANATESAKPEVHDAFEKWRMAFTERAKAAGISQATLEEALGTQPYTPRVIELDNRQPEFALTFWSYMDRALSATRVKKGRQLMARHKGLLARLTAEYGVPGRFLVAFWGLETNYGTNLGSFHVPSALATLAFDGRRGAFFEAQLMDALHLIEGDQVSADQLVGSWAGAMGQTQFMPSTFRIHAVDGDKNGKLDLWNSEIDALTSAANYLKRIGWMTGYTWGREVRLPSDPSSDLLAIKEAQSLASWKRAGITSRDGGPLPALDLPARLLLPGGVDRPAFLIYANFDVIMEWNRAQLYALSVGLLADRLIGRSGPVTKRVDEAPLPIEDIKKMQTGLNAMGFDAGPVDGIPGTATRRAVQRFQRANDLLPDGYADKNLLKQIVEGSTVAPASSDR